MKIKRRFPNYFSGFEETEHEVNSKKELLNIDWIKNYKDIPGWMGLYYSPNNSKNGNVPNPDFLMSLSKEKDKVIYFVVGYIYGDGSELGLEDYKNYV